MGWISSLLDLKCPYCRERSSRDFAICEPCASRLATLELSNPVVSTVDDIPVVSLGLYEEWLKSVILIQKQETLSTAARRLAALLHAKIPSSWRTIPIAWIPGSAFGEAHLVERLARELGKLGHPLAQRALLRRRSFSGLSPQKTLGATRRRATRDRFSPVGQPTAAYMNDQGVGASSMILLDDVVTTGSTLMSCRSALEERFRVEICGTLSLAYTPLSVRRRRAHS